MAEPPQDPGRGSRRDFAVSVGGCRSGGGEPGPSPARVRPLLCDPPRDPARHGKGFRELQGAGVLLTCAHPSGASSWTQATPSCSWIPGGSCPFCWRPVPTRLMRSTTRPNRTPGWPSRSPGGRGLLATRTSFWRDYFATIVRRVGVPEARMVQVNETLRRMHHEDHLWDPRSGGGGRGARAHAGNAIPPGRRFERRRSGSCAPATARSRRVGGLCDRLPRGRGVQARPAHLSDGSRPARARAGAVLVRGATCTRSTFWGRVLPGSSRCCWTRSADWRGGTTWSGSLRWPNSPNGWRFV